MKRSSQRVLLLTVSQKDAASTKHLLETSKIECFHVTPFQNIYSEIENGVGALLIAKEVLDRDSVHRLKAALDQQPKWSFLPIIFLAAPGDLNKSGVDVLKILEPLRNITLLERPIRTRTLVSIVKAALADRQRQYEVRDLLAALETSKENAVAANEAKSSFLANMSHEIRTPLGIILGFSDLIADPDVHLQDKQKYVQTLRRNGELLSTLIDDVLDLSKIEAGHMSIEKSRVAIREALSEIEAAVQPRVLAKNIKLSIEISDDTPPTIYTDVIRLKQILINVIGNAIKFTSHGGISLKTGYQNRQLVISIADTGIGISAKQSKNLFTAFSQADNSITRRFGGTGLGLVLSKRIAQALGGDLNLKTSTPGKGSEFEMIIAAEDSVPVMADAFKGAEASLENLEGLRVLVVDDSKDNQVLIGHILNKAFVIVETADDGLEAIEKITAKPFDVVLMDVQMPRLGGYEAVLRLRTLGYGLPIVALTAHAFKEDRDRAMTAGCNEYLTKPVDRRRLLEVISSLAKKNAGKHAGIF